MKWPAYFALLFFACKSAVSQHGLIQSHTERAVIHLIKIPPEALNDEWFDGGTLEINKPRKGKVLLQFERSGTLNHARIIGCETGDFKNMDDCYTIREISFNVPRASTIDISDLEGTYRIEYGSCNMGGNYTLIVK